MPVSRWMRRDVTTIDAGDSVRQAVSRMRERGIRHLPVLDARKRLIGIVTDRDLRQVVLDAAIGRADADRLGDLDVREVMTWGVVTVTAATDLCEAAQVMREQQLGALPVVDPAGRVVGMLTEHDLIGALQSLLRERTIHVRPAAGEPGGTYDPGVEAPPDGDAWQDCAAAD